MFVLDISPICETLLYATGSLFVIGIVFCATSNCGCQNSTETHRQIYKNKNVCDNFVDDNFVGDLNKNTDDNSVDNLIKNANNNFVGDLHKNTDDNSVDNLIKNTNNNFVCDLNKNIDDNSVDNLIKNTNKYLNEMSDTDYLKSLIKHFGSNPKN